MTSVPSDEAALREIAAVLAAPNEAGAAVGYAQKEAALRGIIEEMSPDGCRTLALRLRAAAEGDALAAGFGRMTRERRAGLLAFLDDARKREAQRLEASRRVVR